MGNDNITYAQAEPHKYNYKKTSWKRFAKELDQRFNIKVPNNRNCTTHEIDEYLLNINKVILNTIEASVPKFKPTDSTQRFITPSIKRLQQQKAQAITLLNRTKKYNPNNKYLINQLKSNIKLLKENLHDEFTKAENKYWAKQIQQIDHRKSDTFFPKINKILRPRQNTQIQDMHIPATEIDILTRSNCNLNNATQTNNTYIISDNQDKLNIIGAVYEKINKPRNLNHGTRLKETVDKHAEEIENELAQNRLANNTITSFNNNNSATAPSPINNENIFCDLIETTKIYSKLPNKTSCGIDNIPLIVLKHITPKIIIEYTTLFNHCINNYYFPKIWKMAKVLPLPKKGKTPNHPLNTRPISLGCNNSKVLEIIINNRLNQHCTKNKVIPDAQFGFKNKQSTTNAINKLLSDINTHVHNREIVAAALVDLEKAFDSVWIRGLIHKLQNFKFPKWLTLFTLDMLSGKKFKTWDGANFSSEVFLVEDGLQQGTVNSPILFNIYTSGLLKLYNMNNNNNRYAIAFADDLIVYLAGKNVKLLQDHLEKLLDNIFKYYKLWNLTPNPSKCEIITFHRPVTNMSGKQKKELQAFKIIANKTDTHDGIIIPRKKSVKYLGYNIDYLLRGNEHIQHQLTKAKQTLKINSKLFYNKHLSTKAKTICYQLLIRPILTYACPIWWNMGPSMMEELRVLERSILRICTEKSRSKKTNYKRYINNTELLNIAEVSRIDSFILQLTREYFSRTIKSTNSYIRNLSTPDDNTTIDQNTSGYLAPQSFIYFDKIGAIQDHLNIPTVYHRARQKTNKIISIPSGTNTANNTNLIYSTRLPLKDSNNFSRLNTIKYWWLENTATILRLQERATRVRNQRIQR